MRWIPKQKLSINLDFVYWKAVALRGFDFKVFQSATSDNDITVRAFIRAFLFRIIFDDAINYGVEHLSVDVDYQSSFA